MYDDDDDYDGYRNEAQRSQAGFREDLRSWVNDDPEKCICHGSGWCLSNLDVWEECPRHRGLPHPEEDDCGCGCVGETYDGLPIRPVEVFNDDIPF